MQDSEALALVAVLQAAFPSFTGGEPTARLFATKLADYDAHDAARGINSLVDHREDTAWPSWAEVARWIREARPRPPQLAEPEPERIPPEEIAALLKRSGVGRIIPPADAPGQVEARIAQAREELRKVDL